MNDIKKYRSWFLAFISIILVIPALHLYGTFSTPVKIKNLDSDYRLLSEYYELNHDLTQLTSSARAYVLHMDGQYISEFDELGIAVVTREMDLFNRAASETDRDALKKIIDLTEAYITSYRNEVVPLLENGDQDYMEVYREKCEPLAYELSVVSRQALAGMREDFTRHTVSETAMESSLWVFSAFLMVAALVLLVYGWMQIVSPMLFRHHHLVNLAELTGDALVVIDKRGQVSAVNRAGEKLLHVRAKDIEGEPLNEVMVRYPLLQGLFQPLLDLASKDAEAVNNQVIFELGGQRMLLSADYHPLYFAGQLSGAMLVTRPVEIHKDKRFLFDAIEAERKKISIEIHDWVGRNMSTIIHSLDYTLKTGAGRVPVDLNEDLVKLRFQCQSAAMDMRGIMNDIHPYLIDKVGLLSALESYVTRFEQIHGRKVYIFYRDRVLNLGKAEEIIVYRIIQEALTNVVKHSNANEVDIYFKETDGSLQVEVMDNGESQGQLAAGNGLWGMKERANLIGGDLVCNGGETGFAVTLTVPVTAEGKTNGPDKDNAC
ncbi:MAG TPA: hypothetical protein DEF34_06610 [Desulfotomaculum sp.]|nr:MAG: hypothetical protein VR67_03900 [Peptococcaceae bacterium BRH_c8a]KJS75543.1 MAG: hypothetical protein JL56_07790 [Desulfotomaculum sp. BICA1-6]HBX23282.1 hypothetical protein [Desulfotomaculum sp.]